MNIADTTTMSNRALRRLQQAEQLADLVPSANGDEDVEEEGEVVAFPVKKKKKQRTVNPFELVTLAL